MNNGGSLAPAAASQPCQQRIARPASLPLRRRDVGPMSEEMQQFCELWHGFRRNSADDATGHPE